MVRENERPRSAARIVFDTAVRGAIGGFVGTVMMSLYRLPIFRALPPTAEFWAQYVAGGPAEVHFGTGYVLHALYGTVGGAVLGAVLPALNERSPLDGERTALLSGVVYSLVLSWVGAKIIFERLLNRELDEEEALVFHVGHLVYGLTLGTWLGRHNPMGAVYDTPAE
ncbi:DUF6789 family protein [Haloferax namakaokahaiae]|uniref:DUF6789 family protein n=1 Tax=Haloferax namakaokahaiae TaxID=1748331 RepID=A0ABD5ZDX8_9EURY